MSQEKTLVQVFNDHQVQCYHLARQLGEKIGRRDLIISKLETALKEACSALRVHELSSGQNSSTREEYINALIKEAQEVRKT